MIFAFAFIVSMCYNMPLVNKSRLTELVDLVMVSLCYFVNYLVNIV